MLGRLALLFVLVPLVELALLIQVGRWMGVWTTVALVFFTGILGAALARAEGLRTFWRFQRELGQGRMPGRAILDGLAILVGGALLLTPGFLTDVVGFGLLLPPTRRLLRRTVRRRLEKAMEAGTIRVVSGSDLFGGGMGFGDADEPGDDEGRAGSGAERGGRPDSSDLDPDKEILG